MRKKYVFVIGSQSIGTSSINSIIITKYSLVIQKPVMMMMMDEVTILHHHQIFTCHSKARALELLFFFVSHELILCLAAIQ